MSGLVKGIKKVFKKIGKVLKKIIKPLAIAVAVYFTAGIALSYFAPTAGFAASMPGFASGGLFGTGFAVGGAPVVAGGGVFSQVASAIGLGGGLASGAAGVNASAAAAAMNTGMGVVEASNIYGATAVEAGMTANITAGMGTAAGEAALGVISPAASESLVSSGMSVGGPEIAAKAGRSFSDQLLVAKVMTDVTGALFGPSPQEIYEAKYIEEAKHRGPYYGMLADGTTLETQQMATNQPAVVPPQAAVGGGSITPEQQQLLAGRATREELFPTSREDQQMVAQTTTGPGQMRQPNPIPQNLSNISTMPNVRYLS